MISRQFRHQSIFCPKSSLSSVVRAKSTSPYGRSHIPRKGPASLPPPVVPRFPQLVINSDGSTFTHYTTSPRAIYKLTRDLHNHPLWHPGEERMRGEAEEDTGRRGRFRRRFEGAAGAGGTEFVEGEFGWMEEMVAEESTKGGKEN